ANLVVAPVGADHADPAANPERAVTDDGDAGIERRLDWFIPLAGHALQTPRRAPTDHGDQVLADRRVGRFGDRAPHAVPHECLAASARRATIGRFLAIEPVPEVAPIAEGLRGRLATAAEFDLV